MSYDFGLFRIIDPTINGLEKVTEESVVGWDFDASHVRRVVSRVLPVLKWDVEDRGGVENYGQIIHRDWGRFECAIGMEVPMLLIRTSVHNDYKKWVVEIAKALNLSAYDAQTGECVHMQKF